MRLRIFTEPQQGASYEQLSAMAACAEMEGFDAFFRSDHYLAMGGDGLPGPSDAWITLAALARDTTNIRLGTLVTSATFRLPGPLAISVAVVDGISGGRVELGIGAGWYEAEHVAYGIPFPQIGERFERLEEQLAIITGLWTSEPSEPFSFAGRHYQVTDSPGLPKPAQPHGPPVIIGGGGTKRTPRLAAQFAAEYNTPFLSPDAARRQFALVDEACERAGRAPKELRRSSAVVVCCGSDDAEVARRAAAIGRSVDDLRDNGACGTPPQVAEALMRWQDAGAHVGYLQVLDLDDLDHVRLIGREVAPLLA
ncbi:MAG: LLM class F420-dependent oxidoreductase [Actinomycetota bacterium]|nr:LLM class F420-dependent oxidoreductase [Actinomycetota bacterium]